MFWILPSFVGHTLSILGQLSLHCQKLLHESMPSGSRCLGALVRPIKTTTVSPLVWCRCVDVLSVQVAKQLPCHWRVELPGKSRMPHIWRSSRKKRGVFAKSCPEAWKFVWGQIGHIGGEKNMKQLLVVLDRICYSSLWETLVTGMLVCFLFKEFLLESSSRKLTVAWSNLTLPSPKLT